MIKENIEILREKIIRASLDCGRSVDEILLVAVSKTFDSDLILHAIDEGINDFGENYVQEFLSKENILFEKKINWHFIGRLQRNKVKYLIGKVNSIETVDSISLAEEIQKRAEQKNITENIFVEVNTSFEESKGGVSVDRATELVAQIGIFKNLKISGLMTIGPFVDDIKQSKKAFQLLYNIRERINIENILPYKVTELSMGMSHDFETAILEGSTIIRIGSAIFGNRIKK